MSGKVYQLVYFDARPRGEHIRLAFHVAGREASFKDKRINGEEWKTERPKAPQGRLPYMVVTENGKELFRLSQSMAILRYVGKELNMFGDDKSTQFIDEILETCMDVMLEWQRAFFPEDEKKAERMKKFKEETVPCYYAMLEECIKKNGKNGFAVGDKISIADCMLFNTVQTCGIDGFEKYKNLKSNRDKVEAHPKLQKYLKERKDTNF